MVNRGHTETFHGLAFVEYDFVSEHFNIDSASGTLNEPGEYLAHGLRPCLDVHGAYTEDHRRSGGVCGG